MANLEIRLVNIILHFVGAFVGAGGLIVVTVVELGSKFYFYEGPQYMIVDCRPILLAIGGLMFLFDFIYVFVCALSKGHFKQDYTIRKLMFEQKLERTLDLRDIHTVVF